MTQKQRFYVAAAVSALVWAFALLYIFGYNVYTLSSGGAWMLLEPPRVMVVLLTMLAMSVSFGVWRWYKQDRVSRLLTGLNAEEKQGLRARLAMEERDPEDDEYDVVLTPRKRKLEE
jgi:type VI protein secretion system component VasK